MSDRTHALAQMLLKKDTLQACTTEEIRNITGQYPYFSPARFLLLQKLAADNDPLYGPELQKALLYYHDPLQFQAFLAPEKFETLLPDFSPETTEGNVETVSESREESGEDAPAPLFSKDEVAHLSDPAPLQLELTNEETAVEAEFPGEDDITGVDTEDTDEDIDSRDDREPAPLPKLSLKLDEPVSESALNFEPYHTIDYFASQGIKPQAEEKTGDKFNQQVRSFTDWLKVMKKLPATDITKGIDPRAEKKVEHLAAHSVHNADVVTEAMAEVWLKQGNREKAIETYNKLILQNPSKKSFFAAKIEKLK